MPESLAQKIQGLNDLDHLKELMRPVIGELCWDVHLSYGDELRLEIGAKKSYQLFGEVKYKGEWMLGSRGTAWKMTSADEIIATSDDEPEIMKQKAHAVVDTSIVDFDVTYPGLVLTVTFSNGIKFTILPTPEDDQYEVAYWELFMPHALIQVGPGAVWTYEKWK